MMKQYWIIGIMALLMVSVAAAESCFTAVSVPQSNKHYWKAITYTELLDANFNGWLSKPNTIYDSPALGPGYAYNMRIDANCFDNYLLRNKDSTGATSTQINLQRRDEDIYTSNYIQNKFYTITITDTDDVSTRTVQDYTTTTIGGIDYLKLPASFTDNSKHPELVTLTSQVCDSSLKITKQLDRIKLALWDQIDYTEGSISCNDYSMVDCVLEQGKGENIHYATTFLAVARKCGVPTRIAYGVSEAHFDGVDQSFPRDKMHYWIEFYDQAWFNFEVTPEGNSLPEEIEINCFDGIDNDDNGEIDCWDEMCTNDDTCNGWVTTTTFDNAESTDLTSLPNAYSINNLTIGNENGQITWTDQKLDLRGVNLESAVNIAPNLININDQIPSLNSPAIVAIYNVPGDGPTIMKDDSPCTDCQILGSVSNGIEFNIPGKGKYHIQFPADNVTTITPPVTVPSTGDGLIDKYWGKTKTYYNKLTTLSKAIILVIIIGGLWLWNRRRKKYGYR